MCGVWVWGVLSTAPHAPASEMASIVIGTLPKVCGLLSSRPMAAVRSYLVRVWIRVRFRASQLLVGQLGGR